MLANVAYLVTLPFDAIQHAPADRVATATLDAIFPGAGAVIMAVGIMVSTFGCNNGLILAGARAYYAMARDGLFFRAAGELNTREGAGLGARPAGRLGGAARAAAHVRRRHARVRESLQQPARLRHLGRADLLHPDDRRRLPPPRARGPMPIARTARSAIRSSRRSTSAAPRRFLRRSSSIARRRRGPGSSSCCWDSPCTSPGSAARSPAREGATTRLESTANASVLDARRDERHAVRLPGPRFGGAHAEARAFQELDQLPVRVRAMRTVSRVHMAV